MNRILFALFFALSLILSIVPFSSFANFSQLRVCRLEFPWRPNQCRISENSNWKLWSNTSSIVNNTTSTKTTDKQCFYSFDGNLSVFLSSSLPSVFLSLCFRRCHSSLFLPFASFSLSVLLIYPLSSLFPQQPFQTHNNLFNNFHFLHLVSLSFPFFHFSFFSFLVAFLPHLVPLSFLPFLSFLSLSFLLIFLFSHPSLPQPFQTHNNLSNNYHFLHLILLFHLKRK